MCGTNDRVTLVLPASDDPMPGVSTRHIPPESRSLGSKTSTASTPLAFCGFPSSVTNARRSSSAMDVQSSPRMRTRAAGQGPYRSTVKAEVRGTTASGSTRIPTRALGSVDLPRWNGPT